MQSSLASTDTYLGGLERGERNLTLKSLEQIAEQLNIVDTKELLNRPLITTQAISSKKYSHQPKISMRIRQVTFEQTLRS